MADKRLVREPGTVHPRHGRLERAAGDSENARPEADVRGRDRAGERAGDRVSARGRRDGGEGRGRRGRPQLSGEFGDLNRGVLFVGIESAAVALDVASRVLRGAIDRAFDEDYSSPGDIVRGLTGEADQVGYDLVNELRAVPRRLSTRFDDAMQSPRADQGERHRREHTGAGTPADSPSRKA